MIKFKKNLMLFLISTFLVSSTNIPCVYGITKEPYIDAKSAIAIDVNTKIPLYEKNSDMVVPMASTTKIITVLVAIRYGHLDKKVEISSNAASVRGSTVGYKKGEMITINELLYGLMLRSGNDAAIALSEGIGESVEEYVKLMNECATQIGLINTHFVSPHGLDHEEHYSTAYDLALATAEAKKYTKFNQIVSSKEVDEKTMGFTRSYNNINKILWQIPGANGVKTGYTGNAGKCLVTSVDIKGHEIVIVVLNCTPRWRETKKIYEYILSNYDYKKICEKDQIAEELNINNKPIRLIFKNDIEIPFKEDSTYSINIVKPPKIIWNINAGDEIGEVKIIKDGKTIFSENLVTNDTLIVKNRFKNFFNTVKGKLLNSDI